MAVSATELKILDNRSEHPVVEVDAGPLLLRSHEVIQRRISLSRAFLADKRIVVGLFSEDPEMMELIRKEPYQKGRWMEFFGACENFPDNVSGFDLEGNRLWRLPAQRHDGNVVDHYVGMKVAPETNALELQRTDGMIFRLTNARTGEIEKSGFIK